jgi:branched-chain amino acid transport system permease protein
VKAAIAVSKRLHSKLYNRVGLITLAVAVALLPLVFNSNFHLRILVTVWVFSIATIGLNLLMGYAGQVSLGHAGFLAIGAYLTALGPRVMGVPSSIGMLLGIVFATLTAFFIGRPILRLKGHYLAVATLGFGVLVFMVLNNKVGLTGGPDGVPVQRLDIWGWSVRGNLTWYWISSGLLLLGTWLAYNLIDSPTGIALRSIHDSEIASSTIGVDVAKYKLLVFVISAAYAATAGGLFAFFNGHVTPNIADFLLSVQLVTMVVLGGMGSIIGSVVGTAILVILPQFLTIFHDYEHAFLGLIMILTMIFLRSGIVPTASVFISSMINGRDTSR